MKCTNCNYEQDEPFRHCPECGAPVETTDAMMEGPAAPLPEEFVTNRPYGNGPVVTDTAKTTGPQQGFSGEVKFVPEPPVPPQPSAPTAPYRGMDMSGWNIYQRFNAFFSDNLFLAVCILYTVYAAMSIIGIITLSLSVTGILFCIFFWIAYYQAKKNTLTWNAGSRISGTVFACFIIRLVVAGIMVAVGIFFMVVFNSMGSGSLYRYIMSTLPYYSASYYEYAAPIMSLSGSIIFFMCIIFAAIVIVFAICGIKGIHRFAKSVYTSVQTGVVSVEKRGRAAGWLMTFGIFAGISALVGAITIIGFLINAPHAVALIMLSVLVNKYFGDFN